MKLGLYSFFYFSSEIFKRFINRSSRGCLIWGINPANSSNSRIAFVTSILEIELRSFRTFGLKTAPFLCFAEFAVPLFLFFCMEEV